MEIVIKVSTVGKFEDNAESISILKASKDFDNAVPMGVILQQLQRLHFGFVRALCVSGSVNFESIVVGLSACSRYLLTRL